MDDLISRQAAIEALKAHEDYKGYLRCDYEEVLEKLPSVERKKGRWLNHLGLPLNDFCSVCAKDSPYNKHWDFCPNCWADMRERKEE